jgi:short subunit dehydrogenase-like uncharacterized protein
MEEARPFDVVLLGATGFTGRLTAEYLARHGGRVRWAIAGRSRDKLEAERDRLKDLGEAGARVEVLVADVGDPASLLAAARSTRVLLTMVGPYVRHGAPVVAAAVAGGADYVDITGEPEFVANTVVEHHLAARERGLRVVSCCGFESVPPDLGALFTVQALPRGVPLVVEGFVSAHGGLSGGTWTSAVEAFSRGPSTRAAQAAAAGVLGAPEGRRVRATRARPRRIAELSSWALPMPTIDGSVVRRSARLSEDYGPDFAYGHFLRMRSLPKAAALVLGVGAVAAMAQVGPLKKLLLEYRTSGEGPSAEQREAGRFRLDFFGEGGGQRVHTRVSGKDPGYGETAKMAAESALCLALDRARLPRAAGVITPATAMGTVLLERLQRAGIGFERLA